MRLVVVMILAVFLVTAGSLLIPGGTVTVTATQSPFVAKDHLVLDIEPDASVKISYLGENLRTLYLGKTEESFAGSVLCYEKLSREALNKAIVAELGGEGNAEATLTEFFSVLRAQKNGASDLLLMNGFANVFYIRATSGGLFAVYAYWGDAGWHLNARSLASSEPWDEGDRIFFRERKGQ